MAAGLHASATAWPQLAGGPAETPQSNGLTCSLPCEVRIAPASSKVFEPAMTGTGSRLVVASTDFDGLHRRFMDRWLNLRVSNDFGASWQDVDLKSAVPDACMTFFDPIAAALPNGHLFVGGVAYRRDPLFSAVPLFGTLVMAMLGEDERSVQEFRIIPTGHSAMESTCTSAREPEASADKPFLVGAPDGSLIASWTPTASADATPRLARSTDEGRSWTMLPELRLTEGVPYSVAIAPSSSGVIAIAFTKNVGGTDYAGTHVAILSGASWRVSEVDAAGGPYPSIQWGRGPSSNRLFLVYPRHADGLETPVIRVSADQGRSWSEPISLDNPESGGVTVPSLAIDRQGRAFSGFYHARPDGSNQYRVSALDGARLLGPLVVNASPIGGQDLSLSLGHYMGIVGLDSGGYVTWIGGTVPATELVGARVEVIP